MDSLMEMMDCSVLFEAESMKHDYGAMAIAFKLPPMDDTHIAARNEIERVFETIPERYEPRNQNDEAPTRFIILGFLRKDTLIIKNDYSGDPLFFLTPKNASYEWWKNVKETVLANDYGCPSIQGRYIKHHRRLRVCADPENMEDE